VFVDGDSISLMPALGWLVVVGSVYLGFALSGMFARMGRRWLAVSVPLWFFAPISLLLESLGDGASNENICVFLGFAVVLAFVTWGHLRQVK
jgi:hypothetical protein